MQERRDELRAEALSSCQGEICAALARGEVMLGMSETQVLAATGSTADAWTIRRAGQAAVLAPAIQANAPRDAAGELALVQLRNGRVSSYSYQEAQGVRVVQSRRDATSAGRADALAEMLIREGDDLAARGDLDAALNRYDRADVLRPGDPELDYRIATVLDKQLRPIEALIRYQLFLHRLEIEKIEAHGDAYAKLADAIARARERVIVLEKQGG
jgi:tetratricopeptide (TPR) repeat protein